MVTGIGTDIVEIKRIRLAVEKYGEKFLSRVFTVGERDYCGERRDPCPCLAARFAAKEAVLKALGSGLAGCSWHDVEVVVLPGGKPEINLSGGAAAVARSKGVGSVLISLSHDGGRAVAFAVALE